MHAHGATYGRHNLWKLETPHARDTYQFGDYSKYYAGMFNEARKAARRVPLDLQNAYELGGPLCSWLKEN